MPKRKAVYKTEKAVKRARGETDLKGGLNWSDVGEITSVKQNVAPLIVLYSSQLKGCKKIIGFDMDSTLITTKSGKTFPTGPSDWKWLNDKVVDKLKTLDKGGCRVVIFTNQMGIEKGHTKLDNIKKKIEDIISELNIPVVVLISTGTNQYRKPSTRMWEYFIDNCNAGMKVDIKDCLYVGDAAGRPKEWARGKPKDFTCGDRMFAANIGISFKTPEEYFLGEAHCTNFEWRSPDPTKFLTKFSGKKPAYHSKSQELLILVGPPASGKSTFTKRYLLPHGYRQVNRDTLGTQSKCFKAVEAGLDAGESVVVDNTNPSSVIREEFLQIANDLGIPARCFILDTPLDLAHHMNLVRQTLTDGKVRRIPDVGYNMYKKNYVEPTKDEGFKEILKISFVAEFDSDNDEKLFKQWTSA